MEKSFNPYEHLRARKDALGNPLFEILEKNGLPVLKLGEDKNYHKVLVVKRYLPCDAYRTWFYTEYPNGSMVVKDTTPCPVFEDGKWTEYPTITVQVSLYADREQRTLISTGFGSYARSKSYNPGEEYAYVEKEESANNFLLAQAQAIKGACSNAGLIFEANDDILNGDENQFLDLSKLSDEASFEIPISAAGFKEMPEKMIAASPEIAADAPIPVQEEMKIPYAAASISLREDGKSVLSQFFCN